MRSIALIFVLLSLLVCGCGRSRSASRGDGAAVAERPTPKPELQTPAPSQRLPVGTIRIGDRAHSPTWQVEIASKEADRNHGLMFRRVLADDRGMLFFMPGDDDWAFYMRNTYISLDMIFIDRHWRVVGLSTNTRPLTEALHRSGRPCRYVLELAAHQARRNGIRVGTRMEFKAPVAGPAEGRP